MKPIRFLIPALFCLVVSSPARPDEDRSRVAEVTDTTGTVTRVEGLHYCYEEKEGDALYLNRFDSFFVVQGEAVIEASFRNLAELRFTGPAEERGAYRVRPAKARLRSGKEVEVRVRCRPGSFLKGELELGEFRLDMEKAARVVFLHGEGPAEPGFQVILFPRAEAPGDAAVLLFLADESIRVEGSEKPAAKEDLEEALSRTGGRVFVKAEARIPYAIFRKELYRLMRAGARTVLLGP